MVVEAIVEVVVMAMITSLAPIQIGFLYLRTSGHPSQSTISEHNCNYQVNTAQQDNTGHIP